MFAYASIYRYMQPAESILWRWCMYDFKAEHSALDYLRLEEEGEWIA